MSTGRRVVRTTCRLVVLGIVIAVAASGCSRRADVEETLRDRLAAADEVFRSRDYEEAGGIYEGIAESALAEGDTVAYVEACAMRARSYLIVTRPEEGRPWLEKAEARADASRPLGWSRFLGVRGRFEWKAEENEQATATFREMFDYCRENELWSRAVDAAHMVALTGDRDERFEWAKLGIEMAERGDLTGWLGPLWNNLGWDYHDEGRYDEALAALTRAREYHYLSESALPKLIADYAVAHVKRKLGRLEEAEAEMSAVFEWANRLHSDGNEEAIEWMGFGRWELGEIAVANGRLGDGLGLLEHALTELEQAGMPNWDAADWEKRNARLDELRKSLP